MSNPPAQKIGQKFNFPQPSAEVKRRSSHQGVNFIPNKSFQVVSCHPVILLGMAKIGSMAVLRRNCIRACCLQYAKSFDFGRLGVWMMVPPTIFRSRYTPSSCFSAPYPGNLMVKVKDLFQRIPVIRVAFEGGHRNNHVGGFGNGKRHFRSKFVLLVAFTLGDATYHGLVQAVNLILTLPDLRQDFAEHIQLGPQCRLPRKPSGNGLDLSP